MLLHMRLTFTLRTSRLINSAVPSSIDAGYSLKFGVVDGIDSSSDNRLERCVFIKTVFATLSAKAGVLDASKSVWLLVHVV